MSSDCAQIFLHMADSLVDPDLKNRKMKVNPGGLKRSHLPIRVLLADLNGYGVIMSANENKGCFLHEI